MVDVAYRDPSKIFVSNSDEILSATCFFKARYLENGEFADIDDSDTFDRNAGAVQLYKNGQLYQIPGKEDKEYNFISYGNKYFKNCGGKKRTSFGHSERILMKNILDDLIEANGDSQIINRPSDLSVSNRGETGTLYEVLKALTEKAPEYKKYLEEKGLTIQMWSERPPCNESPEDGEGDGCASFINNIFPENSRLRYIVKDYTRADNADPVKIERTNLKNAYITYKSTQ